MSTFWQLVSGVGLLVLGAAIGLVATVAFEDRMKVWLRRRDRRRLRRVNSNPNEPTPVTFQLGDLATPCLIVEGDGLTKIDEESVHLRVGPNKVELPAELEEWRREVEAEQERRRGVGLPHYWNGESYAVEGLTVSRRATDEAPEVFLRLCQADYYTFLTSQQLDRRFADGTTPRRRYIEPIGPQSAPAFMSCSLGTSVLVITADNYVLLRCRSREVGSRPGFWGVSADEGLSRRLDGRRDTAPRLHEVARRGLREELALDEDEYQLALLAFTIDVDRQQWDSIFVAYARAATRSDLRARITRGIPDGWEYADSEFVPFEIDDLLSYLSRQDRRDRLTPVLPAAVILALKYEYGRTAVERAVRKRFG